MKKIITFLTTIVLSVAFIPQIWAYDGFVTLDGGNTIYYRIWYNTIIICSPGSYTDGSFWGGYTKPTGSLVIPSSITHDGIAYTVTAIEDNAFMGCEQLTSVVLPDGIITIFEGAFDNCSNLTSVIIPESVDLISYAAFEGCYSLSLTIPSNVQYIEEYSFSGVRHIEYHGTATGSPWGARYMNGVTEGDFVYSDNTKTHLVAYIGAGGAVTVPSTVVAIESSAFPQCKSLTSVTIPDGVTSIADLAFYYCDNLKSVVMGSGLTSIGSRAFEFCSSANIIIPNGVTTIGSNAFNHVRHIEYHGTATGSMWGAESMNGVTDGDFVYEDEAKTYLTSYIGAGGDVIIPSSVRRIGYSPFYCCKELTSVVIPEGVTMIEYQSFCACVNLTSVTIPNSVTHIGNHAFYNCRGLSSVTIGTGVRTISSSTFYGCSELTSIVVLEGNTKYDSRDNCNAIIETSTNTLVAGCKSTVIPTTVTAIGNSAFEGRSSGLTSVTIPEGCTSIGNRAFYQCSDLTTSVIIPASVTTIGTSAFYYCRGLTSVTIPSSVTSIGYGAFHSCTGLTSITVSEENTVYDSRDNCNALIETATNTLVTGCKNTIIPASITSIGEAAFYRCSGLTYVTIPKGLTSIGDIAFRDCSGLREIHSLASVPPSVGVNNDLCDRIFVPCGSLLAYQTSSGWSRASNHIQEEFVYTITLGDSYHGNVEVVQPICDDNTATLTATADDGYDFVRWNDDNTDNPRYVTVISDTTFTAYFAVSPVYTTVDSNVCENKFPITWNGVMFNGAGSETATLQSHLGGDSIVTMNVYIKHTSMGDTTAVEYDQFTWYGHTYYQSTEEATQLFTNAVGCDSTVTLHLTIEPTPVPPSGSYQITVETDGYGNVAGGGSYDAGETVTLTATANCGYQFKQWSDGSTQNPRTVTVMSDASYTAEFELATYTFETPSGQMLNYVVDCETQTACVTGYTGVCRGLLVIPPLIRIEGVLYVVVSIGPSAFENNTGLLRVMIPGTIDAIYESAFRGCTNLAKVEGWYQLKGLED